MTSLEEVLSELSADGVLTLTLHRPERHNAFTIDMERELHAKLLDAAADPAVRAIVLTGHGRMFCPGADSEYLAMLGATGAPSDVRDRRRSILPTMIGKLVVCAINGGCAGIGLSIALMADVRFAAETATISTAFARRGLPGEEAISWLLPRVAGHAVALDLLLSGRRINGREAQALSVVNFAVAGDELLDAATAYATDVARNCSPTSIARIKSQIYDDWQAELDSSRRRARELVAEAKQDSDLAEGAASFAERRPPSFAPFAQHFDAADINI